MNRDDRTAMTHLDRELDRLEQTEKDVLFKLRRAGFYFDTIAQARKFRARIRATTREAAATVSLLHQYRTERKK